MRDALGNTPCRIKIEVRLRIKEGLPKTLAESSATHFAYKTHVAQVGVADLYYGQLEGFDGKGVLLNSSVPRSVFEKHELAHAQVFFDAIEALDRSWGAYRDRPITTALNAEVKAGLQQKFGAFAYRAEQASAANTATIQALKDLGLASQGLSTTVKKVINAYGMKQKHAFTSFDIILTKESK